MPNTDLLSIVSRTAHVLLLKGGKQVPSLTVVLFYNVSSCIKVVKRYFAQVIIVPHAFLVLIIQGGATKTLTLTFLGVEDKISRV